MGFRFPVSDTTSLDWLEQRINPLPKHPTSIYWAVRTVLEDDLVGYVSIFDIDYVSGTAEVGIYLSNLRGSGVGTDSINQSIERARKDLNLRKVSARTLSTNLAAMKLFKKLGFLHEGTLSSQYWDGERYCDVEILSKFI
ncbi:RimL Acetyltransferases, including N-acetylases of ribosomal proteins [Candidatus Nanopelagicaceae bacterium]